MREFLDTESQFELELQRQVSLTLAFFAGYVDTEPLQVELTTLESQLSPPLHDASDGNCVYI